MQTHTNKKQENKSRAVASTVTRNKQDWKHTSMIVDNRPAALQRRKLQAIEKTNIRQPYCPHVENCPETVEQREPHEQDNNRRQDTQKEQLQAKATIGTLPAYHPRNIPATNTRFTDAFKDGRAPKQCKTKAAHKGTQKEVIQTEVRRQAAEDGREVHSGRRSATNVQWAGNQSLRRKQWRVDDQQYDPGENEIQEDGGRKKRAGGSGTREAGGGAPNSKHAQSERGARDEIVLQRKLIQPGGNDAESPEEKIKDYINKNPMRYGLLLENENKTEYDAAIKEIIDSSETLYIVPPWMRPECTPINKPLEEALDKIAKRGSATEHGPYITRELQELKGMQDIADAEGLHEKDKKMTAAVSGHGVNKNEDWWKKVTEDPASMTEYEKTVKQLRLKYAAVNKMIGPDSQAAAPQKIKREELVRMISPRLSELGKAYKRILYYEQQRLICKRKIAVEVAGPKFYMKWSEVVKEWEKQISDAEEQIKIGKESFDRQVEGIGRAAATAYYGRGAGGTGENDKADLAPVHQNPLTEFKRFVDEQTQLTTELNRLLEQGVDQLLRVGSAAEKAKTLKWMMKVKNSYQGYLATTMEIYMNIKSESTQEVAKWQTMQSELARNHVRWQTAVEGVTLAVGGVVTAARYAGQDGTAGDTKFELDIKAPQSVNIIRESEGRDEWRIASIGATELQGTIKPGAAVAAIVETAAILAGLTKVVSLWYAWRKATASHGEPVQADQARLAILLDLGSRQLLADKGLVESTYRNALETVKTYAAVR